MKVGTRAITRLETLATQASKSRKQILRGEDSCDPLDQLPPYEVRCMCVNDLFQLQLSLN